FAGGWRGARHVLWSSYRPSVSQPIVRCRIWRCLRGRARGAYRYRHQRRLYEAAPSEPEARYVRAVRSCPQRYARQGTGRAQGYRRHAPEDVTHAGRRTEAPERAQYGAEGGSGSFLNPRWPRTPTESSAGAG